MMSGPLLHIKQLSLSTSSGPLIDDVSFSIHGGEILALTGKSGSGKTSIALAILNLLPGGITMDKGTISWNAGNDSELTLPADADKWNSLRGRSIGYTQQDAFGAFDPVVTMGKQMLWVVRERAFNPSMEIDLDLKRRMEEVGLHDIERLWVSYPHQLSGGQLQRCQIAMALVIQPALLIADEPTSAIDKINQLELLSVFSMLRSRYKMAILCITHEASVVRHLADREITIGGKSGPRLSQTPRELSAPDEGELPVLEVKNLTFSHQYGGVNTHHGATIGPVSFAIKAGTCLGIVGESGSGKSTIAHLLLGLYTPRSGEIYLGSRKIDYTFSADVGLLRSRVQLVLQDGKGSLHPYRTIRETLGEVYRFKTASMIGFEVQLEKSLVEVGLKTEMADKRPAQLSGGESLRVSIARALLLRPDVLICDESTSALDGETRDDILDVLEKLITEKGLALICITHDDHLIRRLAQEIIVLANGVVVEKGSVKEITEYPTHPLSKKIFTPHATLGSGDRL